MPNRHLKGSIDNLARVYEKADEIDIDCGLSSYGKYHRLMAALALRFQCPSDRVTAAFVSLSPQNDYLGNLRSTVSVLDGWARGIPDNDIMVSTYGHCRDRALDYLRHGGFLAKTKGPKIRAFYQNICDPSDPVPVTVDGHMISAWLGKPLTMKSVPPTTGGRYEVIASAVRELARLANMVPCQMQGILWFTWKRVNRILYQPTMNLFGDHWGLDIDVDHMPAFPTRRHANE